MQFVYDFLWLQKYDYFCKLRQKSVEFYKKCD